ncbi:hypothetical protein CYY_008610 [Polysphondylium violaceum]|uniref:Uncharacterized protein n=1 Tax=Polysphondylium violaceum TaxID=133409 RepID=A0A8J4PN85_9MYCE|nr:hypothetical protein CYY_008610 [Polysphondylium violaceum]
MEVLSQNNYIFLPGNPTFQNLYKQEEDENSNVVFHSSPISHSKSMTPSSSISSPSSLLLSTPLTSSPSTSSTSLLSSGGLGPQSKSLPNSCSNTPVMAPVSWKKCCSLPRCLLCTNGTPRCLCMNHPSWTLILRVVFFSLSQLYPDKEFFNLKKEVYVYLNDHWDILSPNQNQSHNWRRQVQDALSHSRFFRSGRHTLRCNGYWQLKLLCNPWSYINSKQFETLKVDEQPSSLSSSSCSTSSSPSSSPINLPKEDHLSHISSPIEIAWRISSPNNNNNNSKKLNNINNSNNNNNNKNNNDSFNNINNTLNNKLMDIKQLLHNGTLHNNNNNLNNNINNLNINNNQQDEEYNDLSSPSSNYQSDDAPSSPFTPQSSSKSLHFSALNALSNFSLSQITLPPPPKMVQPSSTDQADDKIYQMKSILNCTF